MNSILNIMGHNTTTEAYTVGGLLNFENLFSRDARDIASKADNLLDKAKPHSKKIH